MHPLLIGGICVLITLAIWAAIIIAVITMRQAQANRFASRAKELGVQIFSPGSVSKKCHPAQTFAQEAVYYYLKVHYSATLAELSAWLGVNDHDDHLLQATLDIMSKNQKIITKDHQDYPDPYLQSWHFGHD
ncbi:MAG: hypothetical protein WC310_00460 [Patescibacteria group bacterium]